MIFCGQEEPLQTNLHIRCYDEQRQCYTWNEQRDEHVARYSFVAQGDMPNESVALAAIGKRIVTQADTPAFWLNVWKPSKPGEKHHYYLRALQARRAQEGWQTQSIGDVVLAWISLPHSISELWPPVLQPWEGSICIALATDAVIQILPKTLSAPAVEAAAVSQQVIPSREWFTWLEHNRASLLYPAWHHNDRAGLIMVSPYQLPVQQWLEEKILDAVYSGSEAYRAWQQ